MLFPLSLRTRKIGLRNKYKTKIKKLSIYKEPIRVSQLITLDLIRL